MITPDLKAPNSSWVKNLIVFGSIAVVSFGSVAGLYIYKKRGENNPIQKTFIEQTGIDPDFFSQDDQEQELITPIIQYFEPEPEIRIVTKVIEPEKKKPEQKKIEKKKPESKDLFFFEEKNKPEPNKEFRNQINNSRRGPASIFVSTRGNLNFQNVSAVRSGQKLKKWQEPEIKASYPIKMERVITIDKWIPAILINAINSELGGKVVATVEKNIYGSHGRKILIPAGSKAVGFYEPLKKIGQNRLSIQWPRIITPDGINIHTGDADMTDSMGRSGITGSVDKRYGDRYGAALLISMLTAATSYSIPVRNTNQQVVVESLGRETSSLSKSILDVHLDIKPRITIEPGSRIMITASKDIWFELPKNNTINLKEY